MSRINFSFNIQVQRFTRLHGITNKCVWFQSLQEAKEQSVSTQKCLFCSSGEQEAWVDSVREKLVLGFISRSCQMGLCDGAAQLFPLQDLWMLWPDLHLDFCRHCLECELQSCCKITVIDIGSFTVPQKQPALLKLYIAKPASGEEPIRIPPVCLGQQCQWALSDPRGCSSGTPTPQGQGSWASPPQQLCPGRGDPWGMCFREEKALNTVSHTWVWAERVKSLEK